ncbi:MAG: hypothetical protein ACYC05_01205 [Sulfuricella sp.]|nr:hypothetical protein [Gammaproteobacteria bacterium]
MAIPGLHLTQIGSSDFLLEPLRNLNIRDQDLLLESITSHLQQARAYDSTRAFARLGSESFRVSRLYYDLAQQALIDPVYYAWLDTLARTVRAINVKMICIHMQPTAAFALARFMHEIPAFETALDISGWKKSGQ